MSLTILKFFDFLVLLINEIIWTSEYFLISIMFTLAFGFPASFLVWNFRKGSSSKHFLRCFKERSFTWGVIMTFSLFRIGRILSSNLQLFAAFLSGFVPALMMIFFLEKDLTSPPALLTFPLVKKAKENWNLIGIGILILAQIAAISLISEFAGVLGEVLLREEVAIIQIKRFFVAVSLMFISSIWIYLLGSRIVDFFGKRAIPSFTDQLLGELPDKFETILKEIEEVEPPYFYPILSILIVIAFISGLSFGMTVEDYFRRAVIILFIPVGLSATFFTFKKVGELSSYGIQESAKKHILRKSLVGTSLFIVLGGALMLILVCIFFSFYEAYIRCIILRVDWFSPQVELEGMFRGFGEVATSLNRLLNLGVWFSRIFLLYGETLLITIPLAFWLHTSEFGRGLKLLVSTLGFASASIVGGLILSGGELISSV